MAGNYNNKSASEVSQGRVSVSTSGWTLLCANGTSNYPHRSWVRIQTQGKPGNVVYLFYQNQGESAPTSAVPVKAHTAFRGTATWVEPVGQQVNIWGRMDNKGGTSENSVAVIVTEFA